MRPDQSSLLLGIKRFLPFLPSVVLFGLIFGFTGGLSGLPLLLVSSMSYIIFAGSAQFFIILLIIDGEMGIALIIAGIIINLRHLLYGAALFNDIKSKGLKRFLLAYFLTDEAYLVTTLVKRDLEAKRMTSFINLEDVLLGAGFFLWSVWNISTVIGYLITPFIQNFLILSAEFIVASTFLGYLIMQFYRGNSSEKKFIGIMSAISFFLAFIIQSTLLLVTTLLIGMILTNFIEFHEKDDKMDSTLISN